MANVLDGGNVCNISNDFSKLKSQSIKRMQYDKNGNFIKEWSSAKEAEKNLGISNTSIIRVCLGKRKTAGGFIWKNKFENQKFIKNISQEAKGYIKEKFSKVIVQYDIEGNYINEWSSIEEAMKITNIRNISRSVDKNTLAGGFIWVSKNLNYEQKLPLALLSDIIKNSHKIILQYSLDGFLIKKHFSLKDVSEMFDVTKQRLLRTCKRNGILSGFIWCYYMGGDIKNKI